MVEVVYIGLVVEEADMTKAVKVVTNQNYSDRHGIRRTNANGFGFLSLWLSPVLCRLQPEEEECSLKICEALLITGH